jgi:NodT family efflux transporter outer membrane factor (OMF) lipoprotein
MTRSASKTQVFAQPLASTILLCGALSACMVGPNYHRPSMPTPPAYKEAAGWSPAEPSDAADRTDWWTVFGDPVLNGLEAKVNVSNQTLIADEAAYRVAHALVAQDRAALFPTISIGASATSTGTGGGGTGTVINGVTTSGTGGTVRNIYEPTVGGTWAPDIWGSVRRTIQNAKGLAQASATTLAYARLSTQTEMAVDYISLRQLDEEKRIFDSEVAAYQRTLDITINKYKVGYAAESDILTARSLLLSAQASDTDLAQQRAKMEHAIALLAGEAPASLDLPSAPWSMKLPLLPATVPSTLLQRRPDIVSSERSAMAANALIGVAVAAYYPSLTLTGEAGQDSSTMANLFNASNSFWSVGASVSETVFDAGLRAAKVRGARAAYDEAVANYRQTVLTALGQVEDNLAAQRVYVPEEAQLKQAADVAAANETITRNEYAAGTVDFTSVVTSEALSLSARNALLTVQASRLATAVDLIESLGGGWKASSTPKD